MKPTADPRCLQHWNHEVHLCWRPNELPSAWVCAICHRVLGLANVNREFFPHRWPQGRRRTWRAGALSKADFQHIIRHEGRHWKKDGPADEEDGGSAEVEVSSVL